MKNDVILKDDEIVEDLDINGLKIIQKKTGFKFGTDAVLLANFAKDVKSENTLDLCTGSAVVPLLMSAKTKTKHFCGIEIQEEIADAAKRSVLMNDLCEKIEIVCDDLKNAAKIFGKRKFDLVTCNPPYMKNGSAVLNENDSKIISRHEVTCTLEDVVKQTSTLLTLTGRMAMVHRPQRLTDIISLMRKYKIEPKRIRFVHNTVKHPPTLVLVEGLYGGKSEINVMPPLILYNEDNSPTEELKQIYSFRI